jgi:hypothetical protein
MRKVCADVGLLRASAQFTTLRGIETTAVYDCPNCFHEEARVVFPESRAHEARMQRVDDYSSSLQAADQFHRKFLSVPSDDYDRRARSGEFMDRAYPDTVGTARYQANFALHRHYRFSLILRYVP